MTIRRTLNWARRIRACTYSLVFVLGVVGLARGLKAQAPAPQYSVTDLGAFEPAAINSQGDVVGYTSDLRVVVWSQGVLTVLGTMGGSQAIGLDINDSGQIAGIVRTFNGHEHFIYTNGNVRNIGAPTDGWKATGINNSGDVASSFGFGSYTPFLYTYSTDTLQHLGIPGGCSSGSAHYVNDSGVVIGGAQGGDCGNISPLVWRNGNFQILPIPSGADWGAMVGWHHNAGGQIAGYAFSPYPHPVL